MAFRFVKLEKNAVLYWYLILDMRISNINEVLLKMKLLRGETLKRILMMLKLPLLNWKRNWVYENNEASECQVKDIGKTMAITWNEAFFSFRTLTLFLWKMLFFISYSFNLFKAGAVELKLVPWVHGLRFALGLIFALYTFQEYIVTSERILQCSFLISILLI